MPFFPRLAILQFASPCSVEGGGPVGQILEDSDSGFLRYILTIRNRNHNACVGGRGAKKGWFGWIRISGEPNTRRETDRERHRVAIRYNLRHTRRKPTSDLGQAAKASGAGGTKCGEAFLERKASKARRVKACIVYKE